MKPDFRKCMIWLHTYSGLFLGWLLFAIFLTGTLSYFNHEISQWMKPELVQNKYDNNLIEESLRLLKLHGAGEQGWRINLPSKRDQLWSVQWNTGQDRGKLVLNPNDISELTVRETRGGDFFRTFHYTLQLREYGGRYLAGIAAMFMLVATFSGIFTHRRFFKDFFTVRKGQLKKTLSDAHALIGIVTIPFCIMICTSGILIYTTMFIPWGVDHFYEGGQREHFRQIIPSLAKLDKNSDLQEPLEDFALIYQTINENWEGDDQIDFITYQNPYRTNGRIIVQRVKNSTISSQADRLVFSASTSKLLEGYPQQSNASLTRRVFYGLHEAHFADTGLRLMLFLLGALASALIATGSIIWLNKRLEKILKPHVGHKLVERLNIAGIAGLFIAIIAYFYANRILPIELEDRASIEVSVFLWSWLGCLIYSFSRPALEAWFELILLIALGCLFLPVLDLMINADFLLNALENTRLPYLSFSFSQVVFGLLALKVSFWLRAKSRKSNKVQLKRKIRQQHGR